MLKRIEWLDSAKAIAIILVVFTHAHERAGNVPYYVTSVLYSIDRIAVPIFFMISGALLLPRMTDKNYHNLQRKIFKFIFLLITYSIATNIMKNITDGVGLKESIVNSIINGNGIINSNFEIASYGAARQMWFMYYIIIIYALSPIINKFIYLIGNKNTLYLIITISFFTVGLDTLKSYTIAKIPFSRMSVTDLIVYIDYFIIGHFMVNKFDEGRVSVITLILIITISTMAPLYSEVKHGDIDWSMHWYGNSLFIFISSISALILIKKASRFINTSVMKILGKASFLIYLSHYLFIYLWLFLLKSSEVGYTTMTLLLLLLSISSSLILYFIIKNTALRRCLM